MIVKNISKKHLYTTDARALLLLASLGLALFIFSLSPLHAQRKSKGDAGTAPTLGARAAYFSTLGDASETLPNGIAFQPYYRTPLSSLGLNLPKAGYIPKALEVVLNYESLSNTEEEVEDRGKNVEYSLTRVGLEVGPVWSFLFTASQGLSVGWLVGFASESASSESEVPPLKEEASGVVFSSHIIVNYEYHYSDFVFSGGSYTVYGADEELPLIGTGLNLGFGYKF